MHAKPTPPQFLRDWFGTHRAAAHLKHRLTTALDGAPVGPPRASASCLEGAAAAAAAVPLPAFWPVFRTPWQLSWAHSVLPLPPLPPWRGVPVQLQQNQLPWGICGHVVVQPQPKRHTWV